VAVYVDCSSNNGTPNLDQYRAAGHTDLMLKASEGTGYFWGQMATLAQQWHAFGSGFRVGYYHWLYANQPAQSQFNWFWSHVAPVWRAGDWLMTDFEDVDPSRWVPDSQHVAVLKQFNDLCRARGPIHTYTGNWYLSNLPQCAAYLRSQPVVMSDYSNTPPANPYGLSYVAHQFTSSAQVAGFAGRVDYNRWLGEAPLGGGTPIVSKDWFDMASLDDLKTVVREVVNEATGPGTHNWAETEKAILAVVRSLFNEENQTQASLAATAALLSATPGGVLIRLAQLQKAVADLAAAVHAGSGPSATGHTVTFTGTGTIA
jgi:GH25 family lysozyme M1 (1,4-beta-N-acetylmuramidase)